MSRKYQKIFSVDTNVLLHDSNSITKLSDNGDNLVIITETVLKELDKFKSGYDEINYNARKVSRTMASFEIKDRFEFGILLSNGDNEQLLIINDNYIIKKYLYDYEIDNNDTKIIMVTHKIIESKEFTDYFEYSSFSFITNDMIFKIKATARGYDSDFYKTDYHEYDINFVLEKDIFNKQLDNSEYKSIEQFSKFLSEEIGDHINIIKCRDKTGKLHVFIRISKTMFKEIDINRNFRISGVQHKSLEQKILWYDILNSNWDIYVIDAIAGTGKTLTSLLCSLELCKKNKVKDPKITYIRKTVISGNKSDELGFLPGDLSDKLHGYIQPMRDNIEFIIKSNMKKKELKELTHEQLEGKINDFENKYNINYEYLGHLRGRNLSGIIILDECQNFSINDIIVILSRITDGSKVFIIGSTKQIDNPYLNRYNNALTFLLNQCGYFDEYDIIIKGAKLKDVHRGKITKWIENITK